jgi:uncharacterized spore protein YtfJ
VQIDKSKNMKKLEDIIMQENTSFTSNVNTLFSDIQNLTRTETVLGSPVTVENKTLVPLMSVTLGYGGTGMDTKAQMVGMNTASGGHGLGAKISANGVIVIDKNSVQIISTNENSSMNQLMSKVPQALSNMGQNMMGGGSQGQQQGSTQNQQGGQQGSQQSGQKNQQQTK